MNNKNSTQEEKKLRWWQLSLLGVACTVGTGFFLGSHIAIQIGGPSAVLGYILAAFGAYLVYDKLSRMTAEDPLEGSFRSYAKKAFGRWAGFSSGWVYWSSELLIMGSQLTALSLFSRFWFPQVPMWCFAAGFGILGLLIIILGTKGFERMESIFAVMKIAAILMFLAIAILAISGVFKTHAHGPSIPGHWLPTGITGFWAALIFAFYGYGGLEALGLMTMRLKDPKDAPKAGKVMLLVLMLIYVASIGLALILEPWESYVVKESPFVVALVDYKLAYVPHLFNAVLIIAGFSTMTASLFAVTTMIVTLAGDGDAPAIFTKGRKREEKKPLAAIGLTAAGLLASVVFALLMPESIYEYITTAAGIMLLYNWLFILVTSGRLLQLKGWGKAKKYIGIVLVSLALTGTLFHKISRPGFFISLGFIAVIGCVTLVMRHYWSKQDGSAEAESIPKDGIKRNMLQGRNKGRIR
ncbi:amino acid permease [Paenibacillus dokdonensis]|uniref:Amino acid permease n=1 Tax=Paenibacillus dokdonensis TaxID=2567944 RepID=A0ABU6GQR0_9BACL|nr:amino acid permease [Paenibacillus dokdonensis]MEC0242101.1 amino acid permease [Paenibacillus dokdonensis]